MRNILPLALLVACSTSGSHNHAPTVTKRVLLGNKLDVLFVVDNSTSTADKQAVFAQNFTNFVAALDSFPGGRPDLHIGVVSTTVDLGVPGIGSCPSPAPNDDGLLQNTPRAAGCTPPTDRYITDRLDVGVTRATNYTGTLAETLSCIAQLGEAGCGFEAPLEAMKRALDGSRPENAGFLRADADLAIVILTDEDDCSVADRSLFELPNAGPGDFRCQPFAAYDCDTPISATAPGSYTHCITARGGYLHDPQEYVQFLATIKDPSQTVVGLIAGDPTPSLSTGPLTQPFAQELALLPSCSATINGNVGIGRPGIRLGDFLGAFGDHGAFETVCQADYSGALSTFGKSMSAMMSPCLDGKVATADVDASNLGLQLDCVVSDRNVSNAVIGGPIAACEMLDAQTPLPNQARPCYWLEPNAPGCSSTTTQIAVHVERAVPPDPTAVVTQITCAAVTAR